MRKNELRPGNDCEYQLIQFHDYLFPGLSLSVFMISGFLVVASMSLVTTRSGRANAAR